MIKLGMKVRDVITGFEGIVYGRIEYLTGCTQMNVVPPVDKDGKRREAEWFDESRLEVLDEPIVLPGDRQEPKMAVATPAGPSCEAMPVSG